MPYSEWAPEDRAGAHIMAGFEGNSPPPPLLDRIREGRVGCVVLFTRNIESSGQTLELTHSLQCAAAESPYAGPLLIAIDQEGGRVSRLSEDFTRFPAARVFGRIGDPELVSRCARACAAELRASGINANFAPVLDILTNPDCEVIGDRAYGDDAELVSAMGAAAIQGLQAGGVAAWAKHFPGIGDMAPDPHETLPSSGLSLGALRGRELKPFRAAMDPRTGVAGVMAAHALYEQIDPARPASQSPCIMEGLLRDELGYGGVAITDDLDMGAIDEPAEGALLSLRAGADIALICHSEAAQERAHGEIVRAIRYKDIPPDAEERSLGRIGSLKARYAGPGRPFPGPGGTGVLQEERKKIVGCPAHRALLDEVMRRAGNEERS